MLFKIISTLISHHCSPNLSLFVPCWIVKWILDTRSVNICYCWFQFIQIFSPHVKMITSALTIIWIITDSSESCWDYVEFVLSRFFRSIMLDVSFNVSTFDNPLVIQMMPLVTNCTSWHKCIERWGKQIRCSKSKSSPSTNITNTSIEL